MPTPTTELRSEERDSLYRYARRVSGSAHDADDLVQEALLRLWRHQPEFPSEGHRAAWLRRVVHNAHIDERRRVTRVRSAVVRWSMEQPFASLPVPIEDHAAQARLQRELDALGPDYRDVVLLVDVREHSYQEAAEQLACPIGTVMSRLHRARQKLRTSLAQTGDAVATRGNPEATSVAA